MLVSEHFSDRSPPPMQTHSYNNNKVIDYWSVKIKFAEIISAYDVIENNVGFNNRDNSYVKYMNDDCNSYPGMDEHNGCYIYFSLFSY